MNNAIGTLNILEAARYNNVKKLVYAASASCYGINNKKIDETAKINLEHPYALSKYMGEELLLHWVRVYGLNANSIEYLMPTELDQKHLANTVQSLGFSLSKSLKSTLNNCR